MTKDDKLKGSAHVETVIGPSVKMEGDFDGQGDIIVEGIVLGNLKTKGNLQVGVEAKITADIQAQNAQVAGEINGNLTIKDSLDLTSSAKVSGDINVNLLSVEKGAQINGKINMGNSSAEFSKTAEKHKEEKI